MVLAALHHGIFYPQGESEEENEQLVIGAGSSNGAMSRNILPPAEPESEEPSRGREQRSHYSGIASSPSLAAHPHNLSGVSQEGLTNLTNLTTLSATDSEDGVEQDDGPVVGVCSGNNSASSNLPQQHRGSGAAAAARAPSPQPPMTTVQ